MFRIRTTLNFFRNTFSNAPPKFKELKFLIGYYTLLSSTTAINLCAVSTIILYLVKKKQMKQKIINSSINNLCITLSLYYGLYYYISVLWINWYMVISWHHWLWHCVLLSRYSRIDGFMISRKKSSNTGSERGGGGGARAPQPQPVKRPRLSSTSDS